MAKRIPVVANAAEWLGRLAAFRHRNLPAFCPSNSLWHCTMPLTCWPNREGSPNPGYIKAFYSSLCDAITTDPALASIPVDDHMVHRGEL